MLEGLRRSKTAVSFTNEFQFFTLCHLWVMAFTGLNITGDRANGVVPWLLMVTGVLIVDSI